MGVERKYLNIIRAKYDNPTANIISSGKKWKSFPQNGILKKNETNEWIQQNRNRLTDREQTTGYQWGEGRGEGQDRGRGLRGTNYYV